MTGGRVAVSVPFYVIEHPDGMALFDCGRHAAGVDVDDPYRKRLQSQDHFTFAPEDTVASHLERLDIDPARIRYVVLSHLHFDHAGGFHQVPNATLVLQRHEWAVGFDDDMACRYFLPRRFYDLGRAVQQIDGEHDLFGDRSITCSPSPGHTPGHQSLRVRSDQGHHSLVSDACYNSQVVESRDFPAYSDQAAMNRSLDGLLARREVGTVMVFGHDPEQWGAATVLRSLRA
jgi:N-acyl homoserine lactone hydrolase